VFKAAAKGDEQWSGTRMKQGDGGKRSGGNVPGDTHLAA
jgi:hypothetical protein